MIRRETLPDDPMIGRETEGKTSSISTRTKVLIGVVVVVVLGLLAAFGEEESNSPPPANFSPNPTFYGGEPMSDELVRAGEVCDERHPFDQDAYIDCILTFP
jgi:hypothetical protein